MEKITFIFSLVIVVLFLYDLFSYYKQSGKNHKDFKNSMVSLGIIGTFLGIYLGLRDINLETSEALEEGIPGVIDGLKGAFRTSIVGLGASLLSGGIQIFIPSKKADHFNHYFGTKREKLEKESKELLKTLEGKGVEIDFEDVILGDSGAYVVLPDGKVVRTVVHISQYKWRSKEKCMDDPESWHKYHVVDCEHVGMYGKKMRQQLPDEEEKLYYPLFDQNDKEHNSEGNPRKLEFCKRCKKRLPRKYQGKGAREIKGGLRKYLEETVQPPEFNEMPDHLDYECNAYPKDWNRIATKYKELTGYECEGCGVCLKNYTQWLHVHHKDHRKNHCEHFNLVALCYKCHMDEHPGNKCFSEEKLEEYLSIFAFVNKQSC